MKTKSIKSEVIAGLVAAGITLSSGNIAFAAHMAGTNNNIKTQLDTLVTAGAITSDQETSIEEALASAKDPSTIKTQLDALVTAGTITSDEETAIEEALTPSDKGGSNNRGNGDKQDNTDFIKYALDALVTAGTITSDQETAILEVLKPSGK